MLLATRIGIKQTKFLKKTDSEKKTDLLFNIFTWKCKQMFVEGSTKKDKLDLTPKIRPEERWISHIRKTESQTRV